MIPSFYNFSVSPTWAEIHAPQVAQAAPAEEIPKAEIRVWGEALNKKLEMLFFDQK